MEKENKMDVVGRFMTFGNRVRMTKDDAEAVIAKPGNKISHLLNNGDGSYSVVSHIVCEFCDYCEEANGGATEHTAKPNIYEKVGR